MEAGDEVPAAYDSLFGKLMALLVAEGDSVTAGQPLAEIARPE